MLFLNILYVYAALGIQAKTVLSDLFCLISGGALVCMCFFALSPLTLSVSLQTGFTEEQNWACHIQIRYVF